MEFGASIFFTDYSITPAKLAVAMEERGFDSVWAAEHSHIPVPRRTRADSELGKRYYDVMDPFVTLTTAACATKRLKVATGICLVIQRDTIQTAKLVASLDQVSGGRFLFGIGGGWNRHILGRPWQRRPPHARRFDPDTDLRSGCHGNAKLLARTVIPGCHRRWGAVPRAS
jgi:alkanesulfonate monooxygenase SsuD/methylene tetrahydromethanopterin reductase-like flavin-dependent oxidoreductase (luciferase family)